MIGRSTPPSRGRRALGPVAAIVGVIGGAWLSWTPCDGDTRPSHQDLFTLGPIVQHAPPSAGLPRPFPPPARPAAVQCHA